jgi:3-hydroxymyristoyl/3-hydroxydecanoyl-(acyl carrier protein) dehydratase
MWITLCPEWPTVEGCDQAIQITQHYLFLTVLQKRRAIKRVNPIKFKFIVQSGKRRIFCVKKCARSIKLQCVPSSKHVQKILFLKGVTLVK